MAFTTTTGAGGTSLIGTSGVDTLNLGANSFPLYIGAQGAGDLITVGAAVASVDGNLGAGADLLTATAAISASTIRGNDGNDSITLAALSKSALINGNEGNDSITLNGAVTGSSKILGGSGDDVIRVTAASSLTDGAIANGNDGKDTITVAAGTAAMDKATIFGGKGSDLLDAKDATNAVIMSGDIGADSIFGGAGADTLYGGDGNDVIRAETAAPAIASATVDNLTGGAGADTFQMVGTTTAGTGDIITDFAVSEDKILLTQAALFTGAATVAANGTFEVAAGKAGVYAISGTYTSAGVFTAKSIADGGFDTLIAQFAVGAGQDAQDAIQTNTQAILVGVLATDVVANNFLI